MMTYKVMSRSRSVSNNQLFIMSEQRIEPKLFSWPWERTKLTEKKASKHLGFIAIAIASEPKVKLNEFCRRMRNMKVNFVLLLQFTIEFEKYTENFIAYSFLCS